MCDTLEVRDLLVLQRRTDGTQPIIPKRFEGLRAVQICRGAKHTLLSLAQVLV